MRDVTFRCYMSYIKANLKIICFTIKSAFQVLCFEALKWRGDQIRNSYTII